MIGTKARDRLVGTDWWDDDEFAAYGLSPEQIQDLRTWAGTGATDLGTRLYTDHSDDE